MSLFGKRDQKSDAPKFTAKAETGESGQDLFGNSTDGVFGVDQAESVAARGDGKGSVPPGWVRKYTRSRGGVNSDVHETLATLKINLDATDFANTSTLDVANTTGTADDSEFADT
jgi:hypothetical protein